MAKAFKKKKSNNTNATQKQNIPVNPIDPKANFLSKLHRTAKKVEDRLLIQENKKVFLAKLKTFNDLERKFQSALTKAKEAAEAKPRLRNYEKGPPKKNWVWENFRCKIPFWRPKLPFNPNGYLSKFNATFLLGSLPFEEAPNTETRLVCEYALLAVIYDFALDVDTCDRLCGSDESWPYSLWQNLSSPLTLKDYDNLGNILSMIDTAVRHVEADLPKLPAEVRQEASGKARKIKKPKKRLKPLSTNAAAVYELLKILPEHRGMKGREILNALEKQTPRIFIDQSTLTKNIIPELRHYGIKNKRGAGYYISE